MTIHDATTITDTLAEHLLSAVGADDPVGLDPAVLADAIIGVCDELGVPAGDVYPVISDALSTLHDGDTQRTVAIHVDSLGAALLLQAMDTLYDANDGDDDVANLHAKIAVAADRIPWSSD